MRPRSPAVNGDVAREARIHLGMTQEEVQRECAARKQPMWNLSRLENGETKWPAPRRLLVLADVLGLKLSDLFAPPGSDQEKAVLEMVRDRRPGKAAALKPSAERAA